MLWFVDEGERCRYGLNIERIIPYGGRNRGFALVLFWRGLTHYYIVRLRVRPKAIGPWLLRFWRHPINAA